MGGEVEILQYEEYLNIDMRYVTYFVQEEIDLFCTTWLRWAMTSSATHGKCRSTSHLVKFAPVGLSKRRNGLCDDGFDYYHGTNPFRVVLASATVSRV